MSIHNLITEVIDQWEPSVIPHCSNCYHAKVVGTLLNPNVECSEGHGMNVPLVRLIRPHYPRGFKTAADCIDYDGDWTRDVD